MAELLHELILESACRTPAAAALRLNGEELDHAALAQRVAQAAATPLPRAPNGKVDRRVLAGQLAHLYSAVAP